MKSQHPRSRREDARSLWLHRLCQEIEAHRAEGATVAAAVRLVRRRRQKRLIRRGRLSRSRLTNLFYLWRKSPTPAVFRRNYQGARSEIPLALAEEFLNRLVADRVVPAAAVMASLRSDWRMGKALPGIGTWQDYWRRKHGVAATCG